MIVSIKKEILEGMRTYKFLSLGAVLLFFSIMDPVMNKLIVPVILEAQFEGMDAGMLAGMMISTRRECVQIFMGDVFEIGTLVIILVTSGLTAGERKERTLILPLCSNKKIKDILSAKSMVYGAYTLIAIIITLLINYVYSGVLFGNDNLSLFTVILSGLFLGIYYFMVVNLVMFIGTYIKGVIPAAFAALFLVYGSHVMSNTFNISKYTPAGLFNEASLLNDNLSSDILIPLVVTIIVSALFLLLSIRRMKKMDLVK